MKNDIGIEIELWVVLKGPSFYERGKISQVKKLLQFRCTRNAFDNFAS
jgi:hypothetical protein